MMFLNILIAAGVAMMLVLCLCAIIACGQLHRIVQLLEQFPVVTRHFHYGREHDFDPPEGAQ